MIEFEYLSKGLNAIFGSIAIRALKEHPELCTPSVVDGISRLLAMFEKAHPGSGYYGKAKGRITGRSRLVQCFRFIQSWGDGSEFGVVG